MLQNAEGGSEAEQLYQLVELGDVVTQGSGSWSRSVTVSTHKSRLTFFLFSSAFFLWRLSLTFQVAILFVSLSPNVLDRLHSLFCLIYRHLFQLFISEGQFWLVR